MKNTSALLSTVAAAVLFSAAPAIAAPVITVTPWLAPNAFGSPSFSGAVANAITGLLAGGLTTGSGPQQFAPQTGTVNSAEAIVTGFNSWRGITNPGVNVGPAYAAELGNRMHFGLLIDGQGTQFSISDLAFTMTSSDPGNLLGFSFAAGGYAYSTQYQGILFGVDGVLGGVDDTYVTSGANTQLVDGLVGRGSGNSFAAYCPALPAVCDDAAQAAAIADAAAAFGPGTVNFTGTYTLGTSAAGSGTFEIVTNDVPEPGSLALVGLALVGLAARRRG